MLRAVAILALAGCSASRPEPAHAPPAAPASAPVADHPEELRYDGTALWSGNARLDAHVVDGCIPGLAERLRALRATLPPDEMTGGSPEHPLEARTASIIIIAVKLEGDPAMPFDLLVAIARTIIDNDFLVTLQVRATGEPPQDHVQFAFPDASGTQDSVPLVTITSTSLLALPPGGALVREERAASETFATTTDRLIERTPALTGAPVLLTANPDVRLATILEVIRTLRGRGAPRFFLSSGIR